MRVVVNGEALDLAPGTPLAGAVTEMAGADARRVAVARNGEVVPRSAWERTALAEGDRIEVVAAIQGGSR